MSDKHLIRPFLKSDLESYLNLSKDNLSDIFNEDEFDYSYVNSGNTLVSCYNDDISGVCTFERALNHRDMLNFYIGLAKSRDDKAALQHSVDLRNDFSCGDLVTQFFKDKKIDNLNLLNSDGYIDNLVISKDFQGSGLGSRLLSSCEDIMTNCGVSKTFLTCKDSDERLIDFYSNNGYFPILRVGPAFSNGAGVYTMCKFLK